MYYFASDTHLGLSHGTDEIAREKLFVRWLDEVSVDAEAIFLLGDIFDFWFEYKRVVPKGFTRLLGKLSELSDRGISIHFFAGNHDMWIRDYLATECGLILHTAPETMTLNGRRVLLAHGDNLYIQDLPMLRLMNWFFHNRWVRRSFATLLHPDCALRFGQWWSGKSRKSKALSIGFRGEEEFLVKYARMRLQQEPIDDFVFGHIHCATIYPLGEGIEAIFLGEWIEQPTYATLDAQGRFALHTYQPA